MKIKYLTGEYQLGFDERQCVSSSPLVFEALFGVAMVTGSWSVARLQ